MTVSSQARARAALPVAALDRGARRPPARRRRTAFVVVIACLALAALAAAPAGASVPEIGKCVKVKAGTGAFGNSGCTAAGGTKAFEWHSGAAENAGFVMTMKEATVGELANLESLKCTGMLAIGRYVNPILVDAVKMHFSGCTTDGGSAVCTSPGLAAGEVSTTALVGIFGIVKTSPLGAAHDQAGLKLQAIAGEPFSFFECGSILPVAVWGSVIVPVGANHNVTKETVKWSGTSKKQTPERFEGESEASFLEAEIGSGPPRFERAGLKLSAILENTEPIEINTVL